MWPGAAARAKKRPRVVIRGCNRLGVGLGRHVRAIDQGRRERRRQWREGTPGGGEAGDGKGSGRRAKREAGGSLEGRKRMRGGGGTGKRGRAARPPRGSSGSNTVVSAESGEGVSEGPAW